jgi:hypothetical protein
VTPLEEAIKLVSTPLSRLLTNKLTEEDHQNIKHNLDTEESY